MTDYVDRSRAYAHRLTGESQEQIDAGMPARFALYSPARRAAILQEIDATVPEEVDFEEGAMRRAADRAELVAELNRTHERLRRIGR
jgi:hypothetical protein